MVTGLKMADKKEKAWWTDEDLYPLSKTATINPDKLVFDKSNPRYTPDKGLPHETEPEIIQFYDQTSDLDELLQSISQSGYIGIEPMIVMGLEDELIVLEGNRRLAAIRLLKDPKLAADCGVTTPPMHDDKKPSLKEVTIYRVACREDARDYIGFKHINGPHKWDSFAKAKYAMEWLEKEKSKKNGLTLKDIANRMGDGHSTILRMINGLRTLEQARSEGLFNVDNREKKRQFSFSHLYTALTRSGIKKHLGIQDYQNNDILPVSPVPATNLPALKEVMTWIYGSDSDDIKAVVRSQNPDIKKLSEVLENPKAKAMLISNGDLQGAYLEVDPPSTQFERHLVAANLGIEKSMGKMSAYTGDQTLMELAEEIDGKVDALVSYMKTKFVQTN